MTKNQREDPKTCLRYEATGVYCWPGDDDLCAHCRQIRSYRVADFADLIDANILADYRKAIG